MTKIWQRPCAIGNERRPTTHEDGGFEAHRTSASPDQWHRCSVITRTSRHSKLSAASILGAACPPCTSHRFPLSALGSPAKVCLLVRVPCSCPMFHVPGPGSRRYVQAGLIGGSGYPASVTADSGRSGAIGGSRLDFWRNAMVRLLHAARGCGRGCGLKPWGGKKVSTAAEHGITGWATE